MASSYTNRTRLLTTPSIYIFLFTCNNGNAYEYPPHQGESEYGPPAQVTNPSPIIEEALECFNDKHIYSSCDETHRLTQSGELKVSHDYMDEYCGGPCLAETKLVLRCLDGIFQHFEFHNGAMSSDVKETIKSGCGYGPARGDFDVLKHTQVGEGNKIGIPPMFYAFVTIMITGWWIMFVE